MRKLEEGSEVRRHNPEHSLLGKAKEVTSYVSLRLIW